LGAEECEDSDGEDMDPVAIEGMVDEDGEIYSVAISMQDMDTSCLYSTTNQWTEFLADVDEQDCMSYKATSITWRNQQSG
jgi:hypothetical protein